MLQTYRGVDPRLKIHLNPVNENIASATNRAAELATGTFVGFLDHDDVLAPEALEIFSEAILANPEADVIYCDEDKIEIDGRLCDPHLKPDWSPELLLSVPYMLHLMLVRKSLFLALGGCDPNFNGAQDYDLSLRATASARQVVHVPKVLYHWRKVTGSAAEKVDSKPWALESGRRALSSFVAAQNPRAEVSEGFYPGSFRVDWPIETHRSATLVILTGARRRVVEGRGDILLVENAVESIARRSTFARKRILVIGDDRLSSQARRRLHDYGAEVVDYSSNSPFNYSRKLNWAAKHVETEDVIFLNDDIEVETPGWIEALLSQTGRPQIGVAGARLLYPDRRVQHAGVTLGVRGPTSHLFHNLPAAVIGYGGLTHLIRNCSAVTGAVMATRMSLFEDIGGYDERLRIDYNDVDFCLRLGQRGYRSVYTPFATLFHFEGSSLTRTAVDPADEALFVERWREQIENDPFYNPALPKDRLDCGVTAW